MWALLVDMGTSKRQWYGSKNEQCASLLDHSHWIRFAGDFHLPILEGSVKGKR